MRKNKLLIFLSAILMMAACNKENKEMLQVGLNTHFEGDSTVYGLACDGCTDSVLVFISGRGGDPVSYDIIDAMRQGQVFGHPHVGDWVGILIDPADSTKASMVINLDELKATWTQLEAPKTREHNISNISDDEKEKIDSMLQDLLKPVEIGFALKRHYTAAPVGIPSPVQLSDEYPVIMPRPKFYNNWHIYNGRLVLKEMKISDNDSTRKPVERYDTAAFVMMTRDSLVLRFKDGVQSYSRKKAEVKEQ